MNNISTLMIVEVFPYQLYMGCGGTIAKFAKKGSNVVWVAVGDKSDLYLADLEQVASKLGAKKFVSFDRKEFEDQPAKFVLSLARLIRVMQPDCVITQPALPHFSNFYGRKLVGLLDEALFRAADPLIKIGNLRRWIVSRVLQGDIPAKDYGILRNPTLYIDVTESFDQKIKALEVVKAVENFGKFLYEDIVERKNNNLLCFGHIKFELGEELFNLRDLKERTYHLQENERFLEAFRLFFKIYLLSFAFFRSMQSGGGPGYRLAEAFDVKDRPRWLSNSIPTVEYLTYETKSV